MLKVCYKSEKSDIATVYVGKFDNGKYVEFVESTQPPIPKDKKWVLIVSTMFGCPVDCRICDCGGSFAGMLSKSEIIEQIDFLINLYYPGKKIPTHKFKIQFARMGEPSLNTAVLDVLDELPELYDAPGLLPSLSSVAPAGTEKFFEKLLDIKRKLYHSSFQLQFSIHSTDEKQRDFLIPVKKWSFEQISDYCRDFVGTGDKKVSLNFALGKDFILNTDKLLKYFNPEIFLLKITPVNPTYKAAANGIETFIKPGQTDYSFINILRSAGYDVILSLGEAEENQIGSNCGQYIWRSKVDQTGEIPAYNYSLERLS